MSKLLIGLTTFNDLAFLKESLPPLELLRQKMGGRVVILDTAWNDEVQDFVRQHYPEFDYLRHPDGNVGYGRAYNSILKHAPGNELFLLVTSDVLLDVAVVEKFIERMDEDKTLSMVAGKLHHWDFSSRKCTDEIDSLGIVGTVAHHFYDRGQGELDRGQYDSELGHFFGISGAVFLFRTAVVPRLHGKQHLLFDERFWMYKEDIDLAYRLRWLGEKIAVFPEVWAWHARTISNRGGSKGQSFKGLFAADRLKKSYARLHSYKNHFLLLKNNFSFQFGILVFARVLSYETLKGVFMLFRSPRAFFAGLRVLLFRAPQRSSRNVKPETILSYLS